MASTGSVSISLWIWAMNAQLRGVVHERAIDFDRVFAQLQHLLLAAENAARVSDVPGALRLGFHIDKRVHIARGHKGPAAAGVAQRVGGIQLAGHRLLERGQPFFIGVTRQIHAIDGHARVKARRAHAQCDGHAAKIERQREANEQGDPLLGAALLFAPGRPGSGGVTVAADAGGARRFVRIRRGAEH